MSEAKVKLMRFDVGVPRMGSVSGTFFATQEDMERLQAEGTIWLCEVLGKHSEIEIEATDIRLLTDNQEFIETAKKLGVDLECGINPLDYLE